MGQILSEIERKYNLYDTVTPEVFAGVSRVVIVTIITGTSHERHGVSNHRQHDCFFNS